MKPLCLFISITLNKMNMTEAYEKSLIRFYKKLRIVPVPLICWDLINSYRTDHSTFNSIQKNWKEKVDYHQVVDILQREIIITNKNFEIIFATRNIVNLNGYHPFEIIGKSPKIFQGEMTSESSKIKIREAIQQRKAFKETLVNYKKDNSTYLCEIEAYPKYDKKGQFINYVAFERIAS